MNVKKTRQLIERLKIGKAAVKLKVSQSAIRDWIRQGLIKKDSAGTLDMVELARVAESKKTAMRGQPNTAIKSQQKKNARASQLAVQKSLATGALNIDKKNAGDKFTFTAKDMAELSVKRQMAAYTLEAHKAFMAEGDTVTVSRAQNTFVRFQKEVYSHLKAMPNQWYLKLAEKGIAPQVAMEFLENISYEIMNNLTSDTVVERLLDDLSE